MTPEVSKQIANLLGQVTVSELPQDTGSLFIGEYWLYKYKEMPASNVNTTAYVIQAGDFYNYLCKNVFAFLVEQKQNDIELHPGDFLDKNDTPVIMARKLLDRVPNWIGEVKPANGGKNLSELWFKHFQYYYFDNLNNRLPTMLLKYGPAAIREKTFDILIWLDSSSSMVGDYGSTGEAGEIDSLAASITDLCNTIFAQNPNNRISIVQFGYGGFKNIDCTGISSSVPEYRHGKWGCRHLAFTNDGNKISEFLTKLVEHSRVPTAKNFFDENLYFVSELIKENFVFNSPDPRQQTSTYTRDDSDPDWKPEWSSVGWRTGWRADPNVQRLCVCISDEAPDTYISVTNKVQIPYKKPWGRNKTLPDVITEEWLGNNGLTMADLDVVDSEEEFDTAWWGPYINSPYNVVQVGDEKRLIPGKIIYTGFSTDNGGYDGNVNNASDLITMSDSEPNKLGRSSAHTTANWLQAFKDNNVKLYYIETNEWKDGWEIREKIDGKFIGSSRSFNRQGSRGTEKFAKTGIKWIKAHTYCIKRDLVDPLNQDGYNLGGDVYSIQPTEVAETLAHIFQNEAIVENDSLWSNSMWESHLDEKTVQTLPFVITKESQIKKIYVPDTAVIPNENGGSSEDPNDFIWTRYDRRNYIRIVNGGWDKSDNHDWAWTDEKTGTALEPARVGDTIPQIDQDMGDIDQTLMVMEEFLDDAIESIEPMNHKGKVIFTASKERRPVNGAWSNVLGNDNECFVWSGGSSLTGENLAKMSNLPKHHHNTVLNEDTPLSIQNVSIIGRPEGETVGGIVKVPTAERMPETDNGKAADTEQDMISTGAILDESPGGAYCGTVVYSPYEVHAAQQGHNNMPLYYKMRAFVHG